MKKDFLSLLLILICFLMCGCASPFLGTDEKIEFNGKTYTCTFYDDFNGTNINSQRWERCPEYARQKGFWKNDCSYVEGGNLVIAAKTENSKLCAGAVRTRKKFSQNKGLYQIRFRIDRKTEGLWYAFWLMSDNVSKIGNGAVDGGEIDIFEVVPNDKNRDPGQRNYLNSAVHWDGYGSDHQSKASQKIIDTSFYGNDWHIVTFEWTDDYYKAYLDDETEPYWNTEGKAQEYGGIVNVENYIKLTAEFGDWGGDVTKSSESLPAAMYVDWVKVYKQE